MDDGAAGLAAIKDCGGIAIVQDPATAEEPSMPENALATAEVDHCVPVEEIGALLARLVRQPVQADAPAPELVAAMAVFVVAVLMVFRAGRHRSGAR